MIHPAISTNMDRGHWPRRPVWVKLRKPQCEQMFSELPLKADMDRFSARPQLTANVTALHGSE
jgi:hypothetical protein